MAESVPRGWSLWPEFALRGTGLPIAHVLRLAASDAAMAVDDSADRAQFAETARRTAVDRLLIVEKQVPASEVPAIRKRIKELKKGKRVEPPYSSEEEEHLRARSTFEAARERAQALYEDGLDRARVSLRWSARDPLFREALAWQNRAALVTAVNRLLFDPHEGASKTRQHEQLVLRYLQRYCTKNESIGFFGPIAFGSFSGARAIDLRPGVRFLRDRRVSFEWWPIDSLGRRLIDAARPYLAPRRRPDIWLQRTRLHHSIDQVTELGPERARVLAACTGDRSALSIGELELIEELADANLVFWTIELPTAGIAPDAALREMLEGTELTSTLEPLERARDGLVMAAGSDVRVGAAM